MPDWYESIQQYKYRTTRDLCCTTAVCGHTVKSRFIELSSNGLLVVKTNYAWDGPSGPTIDTRSFMRASLYHDALYQLIRNGQLSASCKEQADLLLYELCLADGMHKFRAWYCYHAVRIFGGVAIWGFVPWLRSLWRK